MIFKSIKQLKKEIDNKDEGCKAKKVYTTEGGAVRFYTCGRMKKCPNCEDYLIELEAQISQTKEIVKMIEEKNKEYEKHWLDARKKGDKQAEDIFYNTYSNLQEILTKIKGEK